MFVYYTNMYYLTTPAWFGLVSHLQGAHSIQPEDPEDYYVFYYNETNKKLL